MNFNQKPTPTEKALDDMFEKALGNKWTWLAVLVGGGYFLVTQRPDLIPIEQAAAVWATASGFVGFVVMFILSLLALLLARSIFVTWHMYKYYTYKRWVPDSADAVTPQMAGEMMRRLHGSRRHFWRRVLFGKEYFSFIIQYGKGEGKKNEYQFFIGAPLDRMPAVERHILTIYAKSDFVEADSINWPSKKARHGRFQMRRKKDGSTLSLARYKQDHLPGILNMMAPGTWIQLSFSPDSEYKLKKRIEEAERKVKSGKGYRDRSAFDREEEKSFKTRFYGNEVSFQTTLSISSEMNNGKQLATAIQAITHDVNELRYWRNAPGVFRVPLPQPMNMVWTGSEIANLFHIPNLTAEGLPEKVAKKIPHTTPATKTMPEDVLADPDGYSFGTMVHPIRKNRDVRIPGLSLGKHWGLTGVTGSGKSTVLNTLFKSFIEQATESDDAPGFSFIDPKRETAVIALNQMLKAEQDGRTVNWDKVHWVSFKKTDHPPAMNLLYRMPGVDLNVLVDQVMRVIQESGFGVAPQSERLLRLSIQTLLADEEKEHTILGVRMLLMRPKWRHQVIKRIRKNPEHINLVQFWEEEAEGLLDTSGNAILNRIDLFTGNTFLRRIFGQTGFAFPVREWMDDGHMVFYDFGGMSESEIALIGGYLSYLYYRVADTREDGSRLHQFVIDEAQRVKASILPEIQAEMRSKGLSLGISTQTMDKLAPELQKSLVNVVANMFVCQQGEGGAKVASNIFKIPQPDGKDIRLFTEGQLLNLATRTCAIKTEEDGEKVYTVVSVPPLDRYLPNGKVATFGNQKEIEQSNHWTEAKANELQKKAGMDAQAIDKTITDYMAHEPSKTEAVELFDDPPAPKPKEIMHPEQDKVVSKDERKTDVVNLFDN